MRELVTRQQFLAGLAATGVVTAVTPSTAAARSKRPRAMTMWDFSWLERRWPGAGYEDWDAALDALVERGYDTLRIDPYPHLIAAGGDRSWLLNPMWSVQDWGAPASIRVRVLPELLSFLGKCRKRRIRVGLSSWYREDDTNVRLTITGPEQMARIWNMTLAAIERAGLLDVILFVDLCNEWPSPTCAPYLQPPLAWGAWADPRAMAWMRTAIAAVRAHHPRLPLLFSTDNNRFEDFETNDVGFIDAIEQHLWMVKLNSSEFYKQTGYAYERFSDEGYRKIQRTAAKLYAEKPAYWRGLLTDAIARLAKSARLARKPLMTSECWGIVDYKDWPMLPWDWVKELCAVGTLSASATGQWLAIATSNFCGPQFHGMWRDVAWHRRLTDAIKAGPIHPTVRTGRLWERL